MISNEAKIELFKEDTDAVFLHLLKISVEGKEPLRFVDNTEAVVSNGESYSPVAFEIQLPEQSQDGKTSPCRLAVDNVDRVIAETVKNADAAGLKIYAEVSLIMAQTPDTPERGPIKFLLRNVTVTKNDVRGELYDSFIYDRKIPEGVYTPNDFPGLF